MIATHCYISAHFDQIGQICDERLDTLTERHKIFIEPAELAPTADPLKVVFSGPCDGVVLEMLYGWPRRIHLVAAHRLLSKGRKVWFYWPIETAIECIDRDRLRSYFRLWVIVHAAYVKSQGREKLRPYYHSLKRLLRPVIRSFTSFALRAKSNGKRARRIHIDTPDTIKGDISARIDKSRPIPLTALDTSDPGRIRIKGTGAYLRTDFWARLNAGGSYGHTCYVAKALSDLSESLVCFMASRYTLLDDMGLRQIVLEPPSPDASEFNFLRATDHYYVRLRAAMEALNPAYIYERLVLGNYVGAKLSMDLGIPYIVEYNGSELSMSKSFGGSGLAFEEIYLRCEEVAFRQATVISVVSEPIKEDLVRRNIDPSKILVNPNGVDIGSYAPATEAEKASLRSELGLSATDRVIGFIGTFGGWHGVDVLADAMPRVCEQAPDARFLLIGDGSYKHIVEKQILKHHLGGRTRCLGNVPQADAARFLKACDVYVSPHNAHMIDSRFFGSPTKIFEYMAMGGGIVASDLEQIGQVLSPALRVNDLRANRLPGQSRSVLCQPGNTDEFVEGVLALVRNPELCRSLGENSRKAAAEYFTWDRHVASLFRFIYDSGPPESPSMDENKEKTGGSTAGEGATAKTTAGRPLPEIGRPIVTGDAYKDEVQNQWDNNPCGSQYAKTAPLHTLEWFLNIESHRYGDYAPWMPETMEFSQHAGHELLEIGGGLGTDLAQFAKHGAVVTDIDLSSVHLALAKENFRLRGLHGRFIHHDAETLPFEDHSFDVVYSNGVIHHTPNAQSVIQEMFRVLRPGGKAIVMVYAENSLYYWRSLVVGLGLKQGMLMSNSIGQIMSCSVEMTENDARPLVKVYTKPRLRKMFSAFENVTIVQRQLTGAELPRQLSWMVDTAGKLMGWNLIVKAYKRR